jgi:hypothetical protein
MSIYTVFITMARVHENKLLEIYRGLGSACTRHMVRCLDRKVLEPDWATITVFIAVNYRNRR